MHRLKTQLIGKISLIAEGGRRTPMGPEVWGHSNIKGQKDQHSHVVYLLNQKSLNPGESCNAELCFKFHDDDRFKMSLEQGQIIELYEGSNKIGEFIIDRILSPKLGKK